MKTISDSDYRNIVSFLERGSIAIRMTAKDLRAENTARRMIVLRKKLIRNDEKKNNCRRS